MASQPGSGLVAAAGRLAAEMRLRAVFQQWLTELGEDQVTALAGVVAGPGEFAVAAERVLLVVEGHPYRMRVDAPNCESRRHRHLERHAGGGTGLEPHHHHSAWCDTVPRQATLIPAWDPGSAPSQHVHDFAGGTGAAAGPGGRSRPGFRAGPGSSSTTTRPTRTTRPAGLTTGKRTAMPEMTAERISETGRVTGSAALSVTLQGDGMVYVKLGLTRVRLTAARWHELTAGAGLARPAPRKVLPDVPWDWADMPDDADMAALLAVTCTLQPDEGAVIEAFASRAYPELTGLPVSAILAALADRGEYRDEIAGFTGVNRDLAADPRTVYACLALLRLGRILTRRTVGDLLARGCADCGGRGGMPDSTVCTSCRGTGSGAS